MPKNVKYFVKWRPIYCNKPMKTRALLIIQQCQYVHVFNELLINSVKVLKASFLYEQNLNLFLLSAHQVEKSISILKFQLCSVYLL